MKIKKSTLFKTCLSIGLLTTTVSVAPIVLTSCSLINNAPETLNYETIKVSVQPNNLFSKYTVGTWEDLCQKNPDMVLKTIQDSQFSELQSSPFDFENAYIFSANSNISANSAVLSDLQIKLKNDEQKLSLLLEVKDLFNVSSETFEAPVKYNWTVQQLDLTSINELDPKDISDAQWTASLNGYDENQNIIPYDLYMLFDKQYDEQDKSKYVLTYKINPQYEAYIANRKDEFKPIIVNVVLSPYLNKIKQTEFKLSIQDAQNTFGSNVSLESLTKLASNQEGKVQIINSLAQYVKNLGNIQPLRPCVGDNNEVYSFSFSQVKPSPDNECVISFSNNPNDKQSGQYTYTFYIKLPNSKQ